MNKNKFLTTIALVLTVLTISGVSAFAATDLTATTDKKFGQPSAEQIQKFEEMKAKHEEVLNAVLAGDYDTWYALMTENGKTPKILEDINKDNFAQFSKAHQLMEESRQIMEGLGVEKGMGMGEGQGGHRVKGGMMKGFRPAGEVPAATN
ncbi:MAG: hypothetical protein WC269_03745 [Candidatus Gracilibacteria bacterium]|jgi:hypothetical protein